MRAETSWKYSKGKTFLDFDSNEFVNNVSEGRAAVSDWFVHDPAAKSGGRVRDGLKQMLLGRCFSHRVIPATKVTCLMALQSWQYNTDTVSSSDVKPTHDLQVHSEWTVRMVSYPLQGANE